MNTRGILAIFMFEMARARRTLMQSVVSPVLSTLLYFVVFGSAMGSRITEIEGVSYGDIEDTFDRWEINLGETEILLGAATPTDPLESAFLADEDEEELRAELEELLEGDKEDSS